VPQTGPYWRGEGCANHWAPRMRSANSSGKANERRDNRISSETGQGKIDEGQHGYDFTTSAWTDAIEPASACKLSSQVVGSAVTAVGPAHVGAVRRQRDWGHFFFATSGRVSLTEYWIFILAWAFTLMTAAFLDSFVSGHRPVVLAVTFALLWWPKVAITIRRFHDIGWSGLGAFVPIANFAAAFVPGSPRPNHYGNPSMP